MLTKSDYLKGLQCPKLLWVKKNDTDRIAEPDVSAAHSFDVGNKIGNLAKLWYPKGVDVPTEDHAINLNRTKELVALRVPIFEAGISVDDLFSRADILVPAGVDMWDIVEVKSGTHVKDVHLWDVSFQKYVCELAGLKINRCYLMHVNNAYVRDGEVEVSELFVQTDITDDVKDYMSGMEKRIDSMLEIINSGEPDERIGGQCKSPYECPLKALCWKFLPKDNVFELSRGGKKSIDMFNDGITEMIDITDDYKLTANQRKQVECARSGNNYIDKKAVGEFLDGLNYPLYYLDFETINPAVPLFDKSKPYAQIPFQYSLHIQNEQGGELEHVSFLAEGTEDPREAFMQSLKENLGDAGDIIVYNQSFEKSRLKECAEVLGAPKGVPPAQMAFSGEDKVGKFRDWVVGILDRVKDLMPVFSKFSYYDARQKGSASIKKVLPIFSDLDYDEMEIGNGMLASLEFERVTYGSNSDILAGLDIEELDDDEVGELVDEERLRVRDALEKYCCLDTLAEVEIILGLRKVVEKSEK